MRELSDSKVTRNEVNCKEEKKMETDLRKKIAIAIGEEALVRLSKKGIIHQDKAVYSSSNRPHRTFVFKTPSGQQMLMLEVNTGQFIIVDHEIVLPDGKCYCMTDAINGKSFGYTATRKYVNCGGEYLHRYIYRLAYGLNVEELDSHEVHHIFAQFDNSIRHLSALKPDDHYALHSETDRHTVKENYIRISDVKDFADLINSLYGENGE